MTDDEGCVMYEKRYSMPIDEYENWRAQNKNA
jgi:hypothetical protein